ncbi:hypothetical protein RJ639_006818 [Escallonia herrerae]|uniref:Red chlorophyll catabolite reductase n=1 Tax=Escallonia herrerae TaxID=1293975 RepID=A0AA88VU21_9ASTE|nr:hypothetical protein RJ639_006818 [Escallonia herrerae]
MAVIFFPPSLSISHPSPSSLYSRSRSSSASMNHPHRNNKGAASRMSFMEFPYVSGPRRELMVELVSTLETRLATHLLPCDLPPDVQYYQNQTGTAQATLHVRSGIQSSPIDFILGSWLHCQLPSGGELNITSLSAYLNLLTDAPNFLFELIQSSPTSVVLILDLPPRKDLVLHPDYLKTFYEDTQLDRHRQLLEKLPEVKPYTSSSLYIRSVVSPTGILVSIEAQAGETERVVEIVRDHVSPIAREVLGFWLDVCVSGEREVKEPERAYLARRDQVSKNKTIEADLGSSLPRLFGQEVADRVIKALEKFYNR